MAGGGVWPEGIEEFGGTEVEEFGVVVRGDEEIGGLEIEVDDEGAVGGIDGAADGDHEGDAVADGKRVPVTELVDGEAFDAFHDEVGALVGGGAGVENSGDVGVIEAGEDLLLAAEAGEGFVVVEVGVEELDGEFQGDAGAVHLGGINGPGATFAEDTGDLIGTDGIGDGGGRRREWRQGGETGLLLAVESGEQGFGFGAEGGIGFGFGEEGIAAAGGQCFGLFTEILDPLPALFGGHIYLVERKTGFGCLILEALVEPGAGEADFAIDGGLGGLEDFGGFLGGAAEEEAHFKHARLGFVEGFEFVEGAVEIDDPGGGGIEPGEFVVKGDGDGAGAAFGGLGGAGVVDERVAHQGGGEGVKVAAGIEAGFGAGEEFKEEFVDEGGGLEGVAGALAAEVTGGEFAKLGVNEGGEAFQGGPIACAPLVE